MLIFLLSIQEEAHKEDVLVGMCRVLLNLDLVKSILRARNKRNEPSMKEKEKKKIIIMIVNWRKKGEKFIGVPRYFFFLLLKEVIRRAPGYVRFSSSWSWIELQAVISQTRKKINKCLLDVNLKWLFKNLQGVFQWIIQFHNGRLVAAPVTIVGRREYRYHIAIVTPNEAIKRSAPVPTDMSSVRQNITSYILPWQVDEP